MFKAFKCCSVQCVNLILVLTVSVCVLTQQRLTDWQRLVLHLHAHKINRRIHSVQVFLCSIFYTHPALERICLFWPGEKISPLPSHPPRKQIENQWRVIKRRQDVLESNINESEEERALPSALAGIVLVRFGLPWSIVSCLLLACPRLVWNLLWVCLCLPFACPVLP